jgi:hypothetical protein
MDDFRFYPSSQKCLVGFSRGFPQGNQRVDEEQRTTSSIVQYDGDNKQRDEGNVYSGEGARPPQFKVKTARREAANHKEGT